MELLFVFVWALQVETQTVVRLPPTAASPPDGTSWSWSKLEFVVMGTLPSQWFRAPARLYAGVLISTIETTAYGVYFL
jgi:hypothetical protein